MFYVVLFVIFNLLLYLKMRFILSRFSHKEAVTSLIGWNVLGLIWIVTDNDYLTVSLLVIFVILFFWYAFFKRKK
ncbi:hypothetical protein Elgi_30110 [Paenibacillus elgii]|nr:hypothetical protein Elgi_30110 [Paenibacillus elgii]